MIGAGTLALVLGIVGVAYSTTMAYQGDATVKGPNYSEDRHTAMERAFETNDYEAWKNLMQGRGRVTQVVTKDNFAQFAKIHEYVEEGNVAEAQKIREELGLRTGSGGCMGKGNGMHQGMNHRMSR